MRRCLVWIILLCLVSPGFAQSDVRTLLEQARQAADQARYEAAVRLYEKALPLEEQAKGLDAPAVALICKDLADCDVQLGNLERAERLLQRSYTLLHRVRGDKNQDTVDAMESLAYVYKRQYRYQPSLDLYLRARPIEAALHGEKSEDTARVLDRLVQVCRAMGRYSDAVPYADQAVAAWTHVEGAAGPGTIESLTNQGLLYDDMGDWRRAEGILAHTIDLQGPKATHSLQYSIELLARVEAEKGDFRRAEELADRGLRLSAQLSEAGSFGAAQALYTSGSILFATGDLERSQVMMERSLDLLAHQSRPYLAERATALLYLVDMDQHRGDENAALGHMQQAVDLERKVLGTEHPYMATLLDQEGNLALNMRDGVRAQAAFQQALGIQQKILGPTCAETADSLSGLAAVQRLSGHTQEALPLDRQALQIRLRVLGPDHPQTVESHRHLAEDELGQPLDSLREARLASEGEEHVLGQILSFTSERRRLAYTAGLEPYDVFAALHSAPDLAQAVLRHKGIVLDSLLEDRLLARQAASPLLSRLESAQAHLGRLTFEKPDKVALADWHAQVVALEQQVETLEATLARHNHRVGQTRRALHVTVPEVQRALGPAVVLVEFLRYRAGYGAVLIPNQGEPAWVPLGAADSIDSRVAAYARTIRQSSPADSALEAVLVDLERHLWEPVEKALPAGTHIVVLSPDGALNFVSWATLVCPDGHFLAQRFSLRYVASGRDLLPRASSDHGKGAVLYGNPDYGASVSNDKRPADAVRSFAQKDLARVVLPPLPGTATECRNLAELMQSWGWAAQRREGRAATKASLATLHSPSVLHFATHGFYFGNVAEGGQGQSVDAVPGVFQPLGSPMRRSGIALAGAERTLRAWGRGEAPDAANDGILTASEAGTLDLQGTWLVALSACESGNGDIQAGEGVLGLRRGFVQAGAQNLLLTLWPVDDTITPGMMRQFYAEAHRSGHPSQALATVQKQWLVRLRQTSGLASAVLRAGPFILTSQGSL